MLSPTFSLAPTPFPDAGRALAGMAPAARAALWTGAAFSAPQQGVWATGFAGLDGELPGGGWAAGGLIEILQDEAQQVDGPGQGHAPGSAAGTGARVDQDAADTDNAEAGAAGEGPDAGRLARRLLRRWALAPRPQAPGSGPGMPSVGLEWRLLLPALARLPGGVTLIGPPAVPHAAALAQAGLPLDDLVWVQADTPARRLWAAEQVLRAGLDGATLVWLPWASAVQLRRLQMAALASPGLVFVMRPASVAAQSSPAPLRLLLRGPRHDTLAVRVFKRRGPPAEQEVALTAWPSGLGEVVAGQGWMTQRLRQGWAQPRPPMPLQVPLAPLPERSLPMPKGLPDQPEPAPQPGAAAWPAAQAAPAPLRVEPEEPFHVVAGLASA